jgi:hypothetical protein
VFVCFGGYLALLPFTKRERGHLKEIGDDRESCDGRIEASIAAFCAKYSLPALYTAYGVACLVDQAIVAAKKSGLKVLVTVDDYDRLSRNEVLARAPITEGDPPTLKYMRSLFTCFKSTRPTMLFVTGEMPLLDMDIGNSMNDIDVVTHSSDLAAAVGLPEAAVLSEVERIAAHHYPGGDGGLIEQQRAAYAAAAMAFVRHFFSGFRFATPRHGPMPSLYSPQQAMVALQFLVDAGPGALARLQAAPTLSVDDAQKLLVGAFDEHTMVSTW